MRLREFLKRMRCLLVCCKSQITVGIPYWTGNHLKMTKEELLKKLFNDLKDPAAYAGKSKLLQEAKKHDSNISIEDAEGWLKSQLAYASHKPFCCNFKTRPGVVHHIDEQWQIDLVYINFQTITMDSSFSCW